MNIKKIGIMCLLFMFALVGTAAYALNLTPKELFLKSEIKAFEDMGNQLQGNFKNQFILAKRTMTEPFEQDFEMTGDFDVQAGIDGEKDFVLEMIKEYVKASKLKYETKVDYANGEQMVDFTYNFKDNDIFNFKYVENPEMLAIQSDAMYPKYLAIENDKMNETLSKVFGSNDFPNGFLTAKDYQDAFMFDSDKFMSLTKKYGKYIARHIEDEEVTLNKDVKIKLPTGEVTTEELTLSLSEERVKELLKGLVYLFKNDEKTLELMAKSVSNMMALQAKAEGYESNIPENLQNSNWIKMQMRKGSEEANDLIDNLNLPEGVKVVLNLDEERNVVKKTVDFALANASGEKLYYDFDYLNTPSKQSSMTLNIHFDNTDLQTGLRFAIFTKVNGEDTKTTYDVNGFDNGVAFLNIRAIVDAQKIGEVGDRDEYKIDYSIDFHNQKITNDQNLDKIEGTVVQTATRDASKSDKYVLDQDVTCNVIMSGYDPMNLKFNVNSKQKVEFKDKIDLPDLNDQDTAMNLTKANEEEIMSLQEEIQMNLMDFFMSKRDLLEL